MEKIKNMKYRHKLTILLVIASVVPMAILALYSHARMSSLVRKNELEDMRSILEQTESGISGQVEVFTSLLNYLTYAPDIEDLIEDKNMDNYSAYEKYTQVADPLLTVPKSYHDAINQIQLFADSIKVHHEYTLIPLKDASEEWWYAKMEDAVRVQWMVEEEKHDIAAARRIYDEKELEAILCVTLNYDKIFQPFGNIISENTGGMIVDRDGKILYRMENLSDDRLKELTSAEDVLKEIRKNYTYVSSGKGAEGWNFYLYRSPELINSSVFQLLLSEIPLVIACVGIIFFLGLSFSRLFTKKIEELTENMRQVNQGNRQVTVSSDSEDEIGLLIRSFRSMMDEINRLIHEVYENKLALKEFELKALTAQINPHFLYNSLSIINWMAIRSSQKEISRVTLALSTFYRIALSKGADMVTVENCITNIKAYLDIQLVMHDNDFSIVWDIDPLVKTEMMPKLAIQPVVENALEHGLDVKEEGEKLLKLSFLQEEGDILIIVEDNGLGMEQQEADSLITYQAKGYGLKNVNDRICLLYGEKYAIRVFSRTGEGTRVEMRIPKGGQNEKE